MRTVVHYALEEVTNVRSTVEKNLKTQGDPPLAAIFGNLARLHKRSRALPQATGPYLIDPFPFHIALFIPFISHSYILTPQRSPTEGDEGYGI